MVEKLMQEYYVLYRSLAQSVVPAIVVLIIGSAGEDDLKYKDIFFFQVLCLINMGKLFLYYCPSS